MSHHGRNTAKSKGHPNPTKARSPEPFVEEIAETEANRPVKAGSGKHRGDRRDTSRTYTNNAKHSARGKAPRRNVKTRSR